MNVDVHHTADGQKNFLGGSKDENRNISLAIADVDMIRKHNNFEIFYNHELFVDGWKL